MEKLEWVYNMIMEVEKDNHSLFKKFSRERILRSVNKKYSMFPSYLTKTCKYENCFQHKSLLLKIDMGNMVRRNNIFFGLSIN